jgi:hypothetical protein
MWAIKNLVATLLIFLLSSSACFALNNAQAEIPLKGTQFIAYYQEPVTKDSPEMIYVTFYKMTSGKQAEKVLRDVLSAAISLNNHKDIMAIALYTPTGSQEDEKPIKLKNNVNFLLYTATTNKINFYDLNT